MTDSNERTLRPGEAGELIETVHLVHRASVSFTQLSETVGAAHALAVAAKEAYDATAWPHGIDEERVEHIGHLLGASRRAAADSKIAVENFNEALSDANIPGWSDTP